MITVTVLMLATGVRLLKWGRGNGVGRWIIWVVRCRDPGLDQTRPWTWAGSMEGWDGLRYERSGEYGFRDDGQHHFGYLDVLNPIDEFR